MDILIRTELVKDIHIPRDLHIREDQCIRDWIERKGFKDIVNKSARVLNAPRVRRYIEKGLRAGMISRRYMSQKRLWRRFLLSFPESFINYLFTRHWLSTRNHIEWNLWWLLGYYFETFRSQAK